MKFICNRGFKETGSCNCFDNRVSTENSGLSKLKLGSFTTVKTVERDTHQRKSRRVAKSHITHGL